MDEYGQLAAIEEKTEFKNIPDWYEFQSAETIARIKKEKFSIKLKVIFEALPNEKGFLSLGNGVLEQTPEGFQLTILGTKKLISFSSSGMSSLHTECNYCGNGDCVVLSTKSCCYYLYALNEKLPMTKMQFATEHFYQEAKIKFNSNSLY